MPIQAIQHSDSNVSIVVPTYNEADNLLELINRLSALRTQYAINIELIIVDDDSQDATLAVIAKLNQPWVRLIVRKGERGLSSAVIRGLREAKHDTLVVMDADLSHPPETIPALIDKLNDGADFVIGSRYAKGGSTDAEWGAFRWLNSRVATLMARPFTKARDPMSGFFALHRSTLVQAHQLNPIGYKIGLELLVKCGCRRVEEVPIHFADRTRGESKLNFKEQLRYIQHLARLMEFRHGAALRFAALLCVLAAFLVPTVTFLPRQSYYVDETTQLNGLTLGPIEVTKWLCGEDARRFGVPPDRMPPVSYWLGWMWSQVFGLSEGAMRWFGVLCVGLGLIVVFETARRAWGLWPALAAGLLCAFSPNTIVNAVEIRAYPVFLLFAACGFASLIGYLSNTAINHRRNLVGIVLFSILAMYTHYFGVLLAGSLLTAAFLARLINRQSVRPILIAGGIAAILSVGMYPFVTAAFQKSGGNAAPDLPTLAAFVKFLYRGLFGHPAMGVNSAVLAMASLAFVVLCVLSLWPKRRASLASYGLIVALAAGMIVAAVSSFMFNAFDGMHPSYNIWRLPAFAMLLASSLALTNHRARIIANVSVISLIACSAFGATQLMFHSTYFTHGPHRQIAQLIQRLGPENVAVIQTGEAPWGKMFYPIRFAFDESVPQYLDLNDSAKPGVVRRLPDDVSPVEAAGVNSRYLIVINAQEQGWSELASQIRNGAQPLSPPPIVHVLENSGRWRLAESHREVTLIAVDISVFERSDNRRD